MLAAGWQCVCTGSWSVLTKQSSCWHYQKQNYSSHSNRPFRNYEDTAGPIYWDAGTVKSAKLTVADAVACTGPFIMAMKRARRATQINIKDEHCAAAVEPFMDRAPAKLRFCQDECDMLKDFNYLDELNLPTNGISDDITLICEAESWTKQRDPDLERAPDVQVCPVIATQRHKLNKQIHKARGWNNYYLLLYLFWRNRDCQSNFYKKPEPSCIILKYIHI